MPRTTVVQRGAHIAARPFSALVGFNRSRGDDTRQESALAGDTDTHGSGTGDGAGKGSRDAVGAPAVTGNGHSPPAHGGSNGNGHARPGDAGANGNGRALLSTSGDPLPANPSPAQPAGSAAVAVAPARPPSEAPAAAVRGQRGSHAPEPSPRASHEDVMRRARELREHQRAGGPEEPGG
jgi:hypothetical protein